MIPVQVKTRIPGPKSQALIQDTFSVISNTQYVGLFGVTIKSAKGIYLTDSDNNTFLDFLAGATAVSVGYGRDDLISVYVETARKIQHSCFPYSPNEESLAFAKKLIEVTPGEHDKRVLFGLSGSDSVDAAVKIAQKYTGRPRIISFKGGYHGSTGFSIAANGFANLQNGLFLGDNFVMCNFPRTPSEMEETLDDVKTYLAQGNVAALITETIQGDAGNIVPPDGFLESLSDLIHDYDSVFIVDEVQSGVGRSGKWWEIEHYNVIPDILCSGKAITSGYLPMSACIARADMSETLGKAQHLFTYSGHPPTAAIGKKVFQIIDDEALMLNATLRGEQMKTGLQTLVETYPFAVEVRGKGLHIGFEVYDRKKNLPLAGLFAFRCAEMGLYPGYFGANNEVMRLHPPLIISDEEMQFALDTITTVVEEWHTNKFPQSTIENYRKYGVGLGTD